MFGMFKTSYVSTIDGLKVARAIMDRIYREHPAHWPYGLSPEHFDGGVYLVREKQSNIPAGFLGWQERKKIKSVKVSSLGFRCEKVGYYSVGILPEYRRNHYAQEALSKLIAMKAASVDRVQALIMADNTPSIELANSLGVEKQIKEASARQAWVAAKSQFGFR